MTRGKAKPRRASSQTDAPPDYEVGYRKPPTEHQFQKGRSGNPKGRPRGAKNLAQMFKSVLLGKVEIADKSGRVRKMSKAEAMLNNVVAKAVSGEPKQVELVLDLIERFDVKVVEQPISTIRVEYVKPKIPRRYKRLVDEGRAQRQAAEARRQREREAAHSPPTEQASQPAAPRLYPHYHPLVGRQRRR